jgi:hypothetical protein
MRGSLEETGITPVRRLLPRQYGESTMRRMRSPCLVNMVGVGTTLNAVLERSAVKVARCVLRGQRRSNALLLPALRHVSPSAGRKPVEVLDGKALPCLVALRRHCYLRQSCDLLYDQQLPTRTCAMGNCRV